MPLGPCPVCDNKAGNRTFIAREMMFGGRERFEYEECAACGCLWLSQPPADMSSYYGPSYHSLRTSALRKWVRRHRAAYMLAYFLLYRRFPPGVPEWWPDLPPRLNLKLLDVGSGVGNFLLHLKYLGFTNLQGIDPHLQTDMRYPGNPTIWKRSISEVDEKFDAIVLNHSFEHMDQPRQVFGHIVRLLAPDGWVMIRTPVASSFAHRAYGADWVQIDAPRHLIVHTIKSISALAHQAGLRLVKVVYDSTELQFWGSEQYRRDIALTEPGSYVKSPRHSLFSRSQIDEYAARARDLNRQRDGDQACFLLRFDGARAERDS